MFLFRAARDALVGRPQQARLGRSANETDTYARDRSRQAKSEEALRRQEAMRKVMVQQDKQDFQDLVGPMENHKRLDVQKRKQSPDASAVDASLVPSHSPEVNIVESSGIEASSTVARALPENTLAAGSVPQAQASQPVNTISITKVPELKQSVRSVIGLMTGKGLNEEMMDLYNCCMVLKNLLEEVGESDEASLRYAYPFSLMNQDLDHMMRCLNEWSGNKSLMAARRRDINLQVRNIEETFTRHLNIFTATRQSEGITIMTQNFAELKTKIEAMENHARVPSHPENIDQADAALLNQKVETITGHKLDNAYILQGVIEYRENVAISTTGLNFDVFRGRFKTGEAIAIKLYRTELKNDGNGLEFVKRILRQVQLWKSFNSPFILQCHGIGMQMTLASEELGSYDKFQFYLVSPFMRHGNAVKYIQGMKERRAHINILQYIRHAAFGIQYLHHRKPPCVHASIRGENVIIKEDETACLNGFGLTKAFGVGRRVELTGKNFQCRWMAPELLEQNRPLLAPSCDIWSWAMTALELITGKEPYYELETPWFVRDEIVAGKKPQRSDYPTFNKYCPQPDEMWALLEKCWATEADHRPTINQVIAELENIEKARIEQLATPHDWTSA